jgi:2-oxo-4-hydroxy-4-carboxy-5-ureidoimidazoline decarboxylase
VAKRRPFIGREDLIKTFSTVLRGADTDDQLALLRAHPDLAGTALLAGPITENSRNEQADAGLGRLTAEEFQRFTELNNAYVARFAFPFIFAVKGATKDMILASFESRIGNDRETEFANSLDNVCRIFRFRLEKQVAP